MSVRMIPDTLDAGPGAGSGESSAHTGQESNETARVSRERQQNPFLEAMTVLCRSMIRTTTVAASFQTCPHIWVVALRRSHHTASLPAPLPSPNSGDKFAYRQSFSPFFITFPLWQFSIAIAPSHYCHFLTQFAHSFGRDRAGERGRIRQAAEDNLPFLRSRFGPVSHWPEA